MKPQGRKKSYCPFCDAKLSFFNAEFTRLIGVLESDFFKVEGIFYLPTALGKYDAIFPEGMTIKEGAKVNFLCPECRKDLTTSFNKNLAFMKVLDERQAEFIVLINKIYGKHATYVFDYQSKSLRQKYGPDAEEIADSEFEKDLNFFGS